MFQAYRQARLVTADVPKCRVALPHITGLQHRERKLYLHIHFRRIIRTLSCFTSRPRGRRLGV